MPHQVIGIVGATGRLGSALDRALGERGVPVGVRANRSGWNVSSTPNVVFDASTAACFDRTVELCRSSSAALVYAVSDLPAAHGERLVELARLVPVVRATNLSLGHWLQLQLLETAARISACLAETPAVGVWERHPATKRDRPSASAQELARCWQAASGEPTVDVASWRAGHPVSDHVVQLDIPDESLAISHSVTGIQAAVRGALLILEWVPTAPTRLMTSREVFDDILRKGPDDEDSRHRAAVVSG